MPIRASVDLRHAFRYAAGEGSLLGAVARGFASCPVPVFGDDPAFALWDAVVADCEERQVTPDPSTRGQFEVVCAGCDIVAEAFEQAGGELWRRPWQTHVASGPPPLPVPLHPAVTAATVAELAPSADARCATLVHAVAAGSEPLVSVAACLDMSTIRMLCSRSAPLWVVSAAATLLAADGVRVGRDVGCARTAAALVVASAISRATRPAPPDSRPGRAPLPDGGTRPARRVPPPPRRPLTAGSAVTSLLAGQRRVGMSRFEVTVAVACLHGSVSVDCVQTVLAAAGDLCSADTARSYLKLGVRNGSLLRLYDGCFVPGPSAPAGSGPQFTTRKSTSATAATSGSLVATEEGSQASFLPG